MSLEMNSEHPIIKAPHPIIALIPSSQLMLGGYSMEQEPVHSAM